MSLFITFEGPEGSGKTTISKKLYETLKKEGYDVIYTREPGGIDIAEQIRNVILDVNNTNMDARTEALLYAASRRQHIIERILPALQKNKIVLCDRFLDSSLAYQGYARGLGIKNVYDINKFAIENTMPNKTFLFDLDPILGLDRIALNSLREINRLDLEQIDFHHKVREGYLQVYRKEQDRIILIDAGKNIDEVFNQAYKHLKMIIKEHYEKP